MQNFEDQDGQIWFDGSLRPWRDANLHVLSHGLHYGSCVFEGERVYGGQIFRLREHSERLINSGRVLGFEIPYSLEQIEQATRDTVAAQGYKDAYVRPVAWRGSEMMGVSAQQSKIHLSIAVWEWPSYFSPEARMKGIKLKWAQWKRPSPECEPVHAKAAGLYMICTLAKHDAEANGFDDALMLDWRGQVAETTGANIFLVIDGVIHTPIPDCFLDGITRRSVMGLARDRGFKIEERVIMPDDLSRADEIFVTGTAAEVTPVGQIGDLRFTVGPVTTALMDDYEKLVHTPELVESPAA
ncbi:MAG: branched-chain amino acid aminotransferase [Rhodospirillaceae bacterium]|jgi:branched-chain amino acid aminotransferase|nr:branched-chain amino acid aminotransferase [Rhodospirillaceae bacterium]MBT5457269.1 branched-chain amino acid aminotransferase [Rhodospirillaceae bacterium]